MRAPTVVVAIALGVQAEPKMCPSPSGFHPCDCIREVESGTRAEERSDANDVRTLRLTHPNGTVVDGALATAIGTFDARDLEDGRVAQVLVRPEAFRLAVIGETPCLLYTSPSPRDRG